MQILAGSKSYLVAAAMVLYAAMGYFYFHTLDLNAALGVVSAAGALIGIRSGLTTEVNKLLAGLGVDVNSTTLTPAGIQSAGSRLVTALRTIASPANSKIAGVIVACLLISPFLSGCLTYGALFGPSGSTALCATPSQCVYQAKGSFAAGLALVVAYGGLPACPQPTPICKDEPTLVAIRTQAHNVKDGLDAADALVNSGLLPSGAKATPQQIQDAATSATTSAASFQTAAVALPHA